MYDVLDKKIQSNAAIQREFKDLNKAACGDI